MVEFAQALIGFAALAGGLLGYRHAYRLARLSERLDSIGSTVAWDEVEPANWLVLLYQAGAIFLSIVGGVFLLGGVF